MQVSAIYRYPVKSLGGERLDHVRIGPQGLDGDRTWALVDAETGRVAGAKRSRVWGGLLTCRASLDPEAAPDDPAGITVTFPDGRSGRGDDPRTLDRLGRIGGRPIRLAPATTDPKVMEMEWAPETRDGFEEAIAITAARAVQDEPGADPVGAAPTGGAGERYYDLAPLHLLTTSSINRLDAPGDALRTVLTRYRPNLVVGDDDWDDGYVEDAWVGRTVDVGAAAVAVTTAVGRCVMVNLAHGALAADPTTLRRIAQAHPVRPVYATRPQPCIGVYADVAAGAQVRVGDPVTAR